MVRLLSDELNTPLLVEAEAERTGPMSSYRFFHQLYQSYIYGQLDEVERAYLHEDVAAALETLYAGYLDQVAVQLAWHFDQAGRPDRAVPYLRQAGALAAARYAHAEALQQFSRAGVSTPPGDLPASRTAADREAPQ